MSAEEVIVTTNQTSASGKPSVEETNAIEAGPETFSTSPWLWLAFLLVLGLVMPFIPVPSFLMAVLGSVVLAVIYIYAVVQFAVHLTRLQLPLMKHTAWFVISLGLWVALQWLVEPAVTKPFVDAIRATKAPPSPQQLLPIVVVNNLTSVALLCMAVLGGSFVARMIKSPNMLGPVCAIIALIDIWGVLFGGIVSQLMTNPATQEVSRKAMASMPTVGAATRSSYKIWLPDVGMGDYLFLGLLFAVLHANGMNWRSAVKWVVPLVVLALLSISLSQARILPFEVPALPGLLFIGLGVAIPNLKYFQYTREEKFALLYAAVFVVILTGALYMGITSMLPEDERRIEDRR